MNLPMVSAKALLISLPWAHHASPSLAIGQLSSFIRAQGLAADALHLHLEIAANIGFEQYNNISRAQEMEGEALSAAILFPDRRDKLIDYASRNIVRARATYRSLHSALRNSFEAIDWPQYSIVGFTANFDQLFASLLFAKWVKRSHPKIHTVIGGRLVTSDLGESILKLFPQIDWCIDGEGEEAFKILIESLSERSRITFDKIPGLIHRVDDGTKINRRQQLKHLSKLKDPDYDHYFNLIENHPLLSDKDISPYIPIEAGRGCHYDCAFCSDSRYWSGYRLRPADEVAQSLSRMVRRYGICSFYVVALMLTPKFLDRLSSCVSRRLRDCELTCEIHAGIPRRTLEKMKRAGFCEVQIGLEALDSGLLHKMNKGTRLIDNLETLKFCEELGIVHNSNLIAGFPTESNLDVNRSLSAIDFASGYMPPPRIVPFKLRIDSPVYCHPKRYGISRIRNHRFASLLPRRIAARINIWQKSFDRKRRSASYSKIKRRMEEWKKSYTNARIEGIQLLYYLDCRDHLLIEDIRHDRNSIRLEGFARELYIHCESVTSETEILRRFCGNDKKSILKMLKTFCANRIMFREGDNYLSLAIRLSSARRKNMPFL